MKTFWLARWCRRPAGQYLSLYLEGGQTMKTSHATLSFFAVLALAGCATLQVQTVP